MAYQIINDLSHSQVSQLHDLYINEWWSEHRTLRDVERMLKHTDFVFGVVDDRDESLVGFCRVMTDYVFRGTVYDVMVRADKRGQKLGQMLMEAVTRHPVLERVEVLNLFCLPDMAPFYEKWGFSPDLSGTNSMCRGGRS